MSCIRRCKNEAISPSYCPICPFSSLRAPQCDLNAPPSHRLTLGIEPGEWAQIPAGEFFFGQHNDADFQCKPYEIMTTDVTAAPVCRSS